MEEETVKSEEVGEKLTENVEIPEKPEEERARKRKIDETIEEISRPDSLLVVKKRKTEETEDDDEEEVEDIEEEFIRKRLQKTNSDREPSTTETDPMKIWSATDDLSLITAVSHVACLRFVHNVLPFSKKFTFSDLEERFCQLMYDGDHSRQAKKRISQMNPRLQLQIQSRTPFTRAEESCLIESAEKILSGGGPKKKEKSDGDNGHTMLRIEHFKKILENHRSVFHVARTPQVLSDHFRRIKRWNEKTSEQKNEWEALEQPTEGCTSNFDVNVPLLACSARFHAISRKPALRTIQNGFKTSNTIPDNTVATIHGQFLQYAMTGKTATIGRASTVDKVDIDLSKEGPAVKVSRQQAIVRHNNDGSFSIQNIGQRPMFVDGKPLPTLVSTSLKHGSIIEVASLRLIFGIPSPRILHPITRQFARMYRKVEQPQQPPPPPQPSRAQQGMSYQQYPKSSGGNKKRQSVGQPQQNPPNPSSSSGGPSPKILQSAGDRPQTTSMHSVVRRADPVEKERLLKAVAGMGQ